MTYREKLKDPRWQKKRLEIFRRDDWTCQVCASKDKTLQVHHRYYVKCDPWDYPNEALVTLCGDCHHDETAITRDFKDLQSNLLSKGMDRTTISTIGAVVRSRRRNFTADEIDRIVENFYDVVPNHE